MTLITKPDYTEIWASGGAIVEPSDVKKQTGWTAEVPPHQWENWIQNRQDQFIAHVNQRGIPEWDALTEYEASGLSYVQGSDGKIYKSVAASGPSTTVQDPTTDVSDTYWTVAFADVGAFLTQTSGDARYLRITNNLSDLDSPSTARTNLGVQNSVEAGVQGSTSNLRLSATGLSAVVSVTADSVCVKNASNFQVVLNNVSVSPSLSASGANGLDTGTSVASTWYYVWLIWNGSTVAGLFSLSSTSPTMPVGYTHKARLGAIRTDGTGNKYPLSYVQMGEDVQFVVAAGTNVATGRVMASGTAGNVSTPTYVAVAVGAFVPPTASLISVNASAQSSLEALVAPNASYGGKFSQTNPAFYGSGNGGGNASNIRMLLESTNIYWASTGAALICTGYRDRL